MRQHTVLQSDGWQHSLPGLGVGDLPWECTDNPGLADYVYRSTMRGGTPGTTSSHCSARPDAERLPAAYKGLCIGDICPAQTWLDDRWNFRPARARGSALQRAQLAQMIAWSSNTHTAGIHMVAATTSAHCRWMAAYLTKRGGMRGWSFRTSWGCTFI